MKPLEGISYGDNMFHLQSSLRPTDLAIPTHVFKEFTYRYEPCLIVLVTIREWLACVKKAQRLGRNPVYPNVTAKATNI